MIVICNRRIKVKTGAKSQTVNICTKDGIHGHYDYRIRLRPPFITQDTLRNLQAKNIEELVRLLEKRHNGIVEQRPTSYQPLSKGSALKRKTGRIPTTPVSVSTFSDYPQKIANWNGKEIEVAVSAGGVLAAADPYRNLISTGISPWPAPEIIQKLYKSRQSRAYKADNKIMAKKSLGYYSDLQSIHSEDALTWSVFGAVAYSDKDTQKSYVRDILKLINIDANSVANAHIWLWRRIPHPDTLVSGGPEIDFGIQTEKTIIFGEAKWRSGIGGGQGKMKDKDQIILRGEFFEKYGKLLFPNATDFIILVLSPEGDVIQNKDYDIDQAFLRYRDLNWDEFCSIESHPCSDEVKRYLQWKKENSKM